MPEEKDKISFAIPKCGITAEFKRFKNGNWSFSLEDNKDKIKRLVSKSIEEPTMIKIVEDLIGKPRERNDFKKSLKELQIKVKRMKNITYEKNL